MDVAYDHIQEEAFPEDEDDKKRPGDNKKEESAPQQSINQDFQDAYKAFSSSPWGVKLGGFWASAKKQVCAFHMLRPGNLELRSFLHLAQWMGSDDPSKRTLIRGRA
jgi:hypothetical protein